MQAALSTTESILELLSQLVRIPSRAGADDLVPVLACVEHWFHQRNLPCRRLLSKDRLPLGLYAELQGTRAVRNSEPRRHYVLNATLDTAEFGDPATWRYPPTAASVIDGWMYGRGSGDSKVGAAIFAHLFAALATQAGKFAGRLGLLLDLDEHSGKFAGARRYFEGDPAPRPDGVLIGYPGIARIVVGSRGFLRARVAVHGVGAHSGSSSQRGENAVVRAARLVDTLHATVLPATALDDFGLPPQLTVTSIEGGSGYSQVPDRCDFSVDLRLTPAFTADAARRLVEQVIASHDAGYPDTLASAVEWIPGWPAYRVADEHPMVAAMREATLVVLGSELPCAVVGPSNVGNYLATRAIPALCGFGVRAQNLHAADEGIDLSTIEPVYRVYEHALMRLLSP